MTYSQGPLCADYGMGLYAGAELGLQNQTCSNAFARKQASYGRRATVTMSFLGSRAQVILAWHGRMADLVSCPTCHGVLLLRPLLRPRWR